MSLLDLFRRKPVNPGKSLRQIQIDNDRARHNALHAEMARKQGKPVLSAWAGK